MPQKQVIGLGTWMDKIAYKMVERERQLGRSLDLLRTEAGIGASGIPHIGGMADSVRAYAVSLALKNMGYGSELIQFADDMDGLRSIPEGLPREKLEPHLLKPVSYIPDPFRCHESYAVHMENLLLDALEKAGVEAKLVRAYEAYGRGILVEQIRKILSNHDVIARKIDEITGQKKFYQTLPYFAVCSNCERIYTTYALDFDERRDKVSYECRGVSVKGRFYEGCGYSGEADIRRAEGKLSWKTEMAARWAALDIRFEAYGKDLAASIQVNDWVSREILGFEPPYHVQYELFLDASKRKISKSRGVASIFTPQNWYRYGTPQSLVLLLLKRIKGTRVISHQLIPYLMNELDRLQDLYYSGKGEPKLRGLFAYVYNLNPPKEPPSKVPYNVILQLASIAPEGKEEESIATRLQRYGYKLDETTREKIRLAINFIKDFGMVSQRAIKIEQKYRSAVKELVEAISSSEDSNQLQGRIFEVARRNGIDPAEFFRVLYEVLIGQPRGPRLGPYIMEDLGKEEAVSRLKEALSE
ncbi:MAG TPA: lysine--tRNA ligase [Candidatus Caldiarchaeum subterraneum]|uniref:Lysine--tRNA ligase n=1 Tax=Caldiarchaeum subterraneum TaxID=311458 RepID=A0A832ZUE2_CALS0|nr:lysine--tRNA ligase [Aigarchaeota archaeon]HIQ28991.1 lysine--tRNA ligase [Candidatus Caldarchaeum subterraneum]